jgi:hypothetical protein
MVVDGPFQLHPERVPLTQRFVVTGEYVGALVVEAHPFDRHTREHPEPHQVQAEADSDQRLPASLHGVPPFIVCEPRKIVVVGPPKAARVPPVKARDFANFNAVSFARMADCPSESGEKSPTGGRGGEN